MPRTLPKSRLVRIRKSLSRRCAGIEEADQTGRGVRDDVLVVGGDVQHHVVVEGVPDAELEGDGLAEVEVGAEDLVGVGVAQVDVDPAQQQAEVRRLHLVRVAEPEVGPVGHRERHLHVRAQVAVALVPDDTGPWDWPDRTRAWSRPGGRGRCCPQCRWRTAAGAGVVPVVAQAAHYDHVTQVEPVLDERVPPDRLLDVGVGEELVGQTEAVVVDVVLGQLAAELEPVVAVGLPVERRLADVAVFLVQAQPGRRPRVVGEPPRSRPCPSSAGRACWRSSGSCRTDRTRCCAPGPS